MEAQPCRGPVATPSGARCRNIRLDARRTRGGLVPPPECEGASVLVMLGATGRGLGSPTLVPEEPWSPALPPHQEVLGGRLYVTPGELPCDFLYSSELTPRQEILDAHSPRRNMSETVKSFRSCQPKRNVMFLKTHKTASSTILNLLYRFGEKHGLTFALPTHYQFGYPSLFSSRRVKGFLQRDGPHYNIMCNHMRFNRPEVQKVMPADTFYFSIVRNPVTLAESSYSYYKSVAPSFKRSVNFDAFIANPWRYYLPQLHNNHYARNLLWFDFGFNHNANFSLKVAQAGVDEIQQSFHLILLAEYFDQSMVLLRDALCWPLDDIVTFRLNFRSKDTRRLSVEQEERLKQWNAMDWYLYQSFNKTFWQRVERFGNSRMDQEVASLQAPKGTYGPLSVAGWKTGRGKPDS
ncbi:G3ST2 sulfotransferase, partial [Polypterus senegalus]